MLTVVNFSHPIPEGRSDVVETLGDDYLVIEIQAHVDQQIPFRVQAQEFVNQAGIEVGDNLLNIDCVILPGLAPLAVAIMDEFVYRGYCPNILRLARVPGSTPPRFEAVEVMHPIQ